MAKPFTPDTLADRWECRGRAGLLCQEALPRASYFQSVATPATSATWPPAERQTAPVGSRAWTEVVKPQEAP